MRHRAGHPKQEYDAKIETVDSITAHAEELGLVPFFPRGDELFIDLDHGATINTRVHDLIKEQFGITGQLVTISKSGDGFHMYLRLNGLLSNDKRVALQAALGSDPVREALSIVRLHNDSSAHSALFETEFEAQRVEDWRKQFDKPKDVDGLDFVELPF